MIIHQLIIKMSNFLAFRMSEASATHRHGHGRGKSRIAGLTSPSLALAPADLFPEDLGAANAEM